MTTAKNLEDDLYIAGWITLISSALVYSIYWKSGIHLPCVLNTFFGIYCPGCGGTRALKALLQGKFLLSLWYHPLVLYTAVVGGGFMATQTAQRLQCRLASGRAFGKFFSRPVRAWKFHDWYLYGAVALLLGNWILKNVLRLCFHICM